MIKDCLLAGLDESIFVFGWKKNYKGHTHCFKKQDPVFQMIKYGMQPEWNLFPLRIQSVTLQNYT